MSESNARKRNLPSWMSSREEDNDDSEKPKQQRNNEMSKKEMNSLHATTSSGTSDFSKLMEGVVFVLSGFINPERGVLRSQMLEMGAEFQPDWNSNCTLLVCAFANTPKFKLVKADGGTIISKDWISECYSQRKLVDIETHLLHAGKPWRKQCKESKQSTSSRSCKQQEKGLPSKKTSVSSKVKGCFSPSKVKKWAIEDLKRTISWLENQDEKLENGALKKYQNLLIQSILPQIPSPEPSELVKIAAEGILTCIQDAIDALKQGQGIQQITDQWACIPQLVEELAQFDCNGKSTPSHSKEDLCREAMLCRQMYELEFLNVDHDEFSNKQKPVTHGSKKDEFLNKKRPVTHGSKKVGRGEENAVRDDTSYDSDATIEMTEEEINEAYNTVACSL